MDPLSGILSLLTPRSHFCAGFDVGGDQCVRIPKHQGVFCYAILSGEFWLSVEGDVSPILLKTGDCVVLPTGRPFIVGTDLSLPPLDPDAVGSQNISNGSLTHYNGGGNYSFIGCHFVIDGKHPSVFLEHLSPIIHIKSDEDKATLRWALDHMRQELGEDRPGGYLIVEHLAHLIMVQALRLHLAEAGVGGIFALGDKELSVAITAMHDEPAHRWTLESLAERAGMSRTNFAVRFRKAVGAPPLDYLRRWRMLLAGARLTNTNDSISTIALSLGYESESAFSTAFKKVMGASPRQYGRRGYSPDSR